MQLLSFSFSCVCDATLPLIPYSLSHHHPPLNQLVPIIREDLPKRRLEDALDTLCTGDLVLFSGSDSASQALRFVTSSAYSHVGMVVKMGGTLAIWHSAPVPYSNLVHEHPNAGLQLNDLEIFLREYVNEDPYLVMTIRKLARKSGRCPLPFSQQRDIERLVQSELNGKAHPPTPNVMFQQLSAQLGFQVEEDPWYCR